MLAERERTPVFLHPDRIAGWAVALGMILVLVAIFTPHG
jgi:hypothetical protein